MEMAEEQAYRTACSDAAGDRATPRRRMSSTVWRSPSGHSGDAAATGLRWVGPRESEECTHGIVGRAGRVAQGGGSDGGGDGNGGDGVVGTEGDEGRLLLSEEECFEDEERLLSPDEYDEMMRYIEEACREEDLRAEAEVLHYVTFFLVPNCVHVHFYFGVCGHKCDRRMLVA